MPKIAMKNIFHFFILSLFFTSMFYLSCNNSKNSGKSQSKSETLQSPQDCIDSVIALDDSLGKVRNHACERISLAQTIKEYTAGMAQFDYQNCPKDFTEAFKKHREAWLAMIPLVEKYPDLRGEMHDLFDQIEIGEHSEEFEPLLESIWSTWAEVEEAMKN